MTVISALHSQLWINERERERERERENLIKWLSKRNETWPPAIHMHTQGWRENEIHHHHHHVVPLARISLTLSRHFSLSFIASGRSSGLHPVSSHSCWMYVRAGRPAFARPCVGVHRSHDIIYIYIYHMISHTHTHTHTHIYIYIYMCVCVCVWIVECGESNKMIKMIFLLYIYIYISL